MLSHAETANEMLLLSFEASPSAMFTTDSGGRIEMVNERCEKLFGYPRGEMIGLNVETLIPPGLRHKHKELRRDFTAHPSERPMAAGRDLRGLRRDGGEFPVEIGLTPVKTSRGIRVVVCAIDISARLETERSLKNTIAELERSNASLSRFAHVASHDIQEPLRKIVTFAEILRTALAASDLEEARYAADVMTSSAQRARDTAADILAQSRSAHGGAQTDKSRDEPDIGHSARL